MANSVLTTLPGWSKGDAQREQKKSRAGSHDDTTDIWRSKKLCFWKNLKKVLNQLNSASWVVERSYAKSCEVQGFLFDYGQKGRKAKILIKLFESQT